MAENEVTESPVMQTEDHLEEAVPTTEVTTTVSDIPVDYGNPGVADIADPAFDDVEDEDDMPGPGEPKDDDEEIEDDEDEMDEEEEPVVPPGIEEGQTAEPDSEYDHDPQD
jgi:hypothetical protein